MRSPFTLPSPVLAAASLVSTLAVFPSPEKREGSSIAGINSRHEISNTFYAGNAAFHTLRRRAPVPVGTRKPGSPVLNEGDTVNDVWNLRNPPLWAREKRKLPGYLMRVEGILVPQKKEMLTMLRNLPIEQLAGFENRIPTVIEMKRLYLDAIAKIERNNELKENNQVSDQHVKLADKWSEIAHTWFRIIVDNLDVKREEHPEIIEQQPDVIVVELRLDDRSQLAGSDSRPDKDSVDLQIWMQIQAEQKIIPAEEFEIYGFDGRKMKIPAVRRSRDVLPIMVPRKGEKRKTYIEWLVTSWAARPSRSYTIVQAGRSGSSNFLYPGEKLDQARLTMTFDLPTKTELNAWVKDNEACTDISFVISSQFRGHSIDSWLRDYSQGGEHYKSLYRFYSGSPGSSKTSKEEVTAKEPPDSIRLTKASSNPEADTIIQIICDRLHQERRKIGEHKPTWKSQTHIDKESTKPSKPIKYVRFTSQEKAIVDRIDSLLIMGGAEFDGYRMKGSQTGRNYRITDETVKKFKAPEFEKATF